MTAPSTALHAPSSRVFQRLKSALPAAVLAAAAGLLAPATASAAGYPERTITIVSAFPAGGIVDVIARRVAQGMSDRLHTPVIVENRTGAAGSIGYSYAARAKPDGYTLVLASGPTTMMPPNDQAASWNPLTAFSAIGMIGTIPQAFVANPSSPARDLKAFVASAKAQTRQVNYGSPGIGTTPFFTLELLKKQERIALTHISYRGQPDVMIDLMRGDLDVTAVTLPLVLPNVQSGKMKALAVTSKERSPALPEVPTVYELGMPDLGISNWFALLGPANLPNDVVAVLARTLGEVIASAQTRDNLKEIGLLTQTASPADTLAFVKTDLARWTAMMATVTQAEAPAK